MHVVAGPVPVIVAVGSAVLTALVAVIAAGRRAARVQPTRALAESSAEPRLIGPLRMLGAVVALGERARPAVDSRRAATIPARAADASTGVIGRRS